MDRSGSITYLLLPVHIGPIGSVSLTQGECRGPLGEKFSVQLPHLESMLSHKITLLDPNPIFYSVLLVSKSKACLDLNSQ